MINYSEIMPENSVSALKLLIGKDIVEIYSPGISIEKNWITGFSFSIPVKGESKKWVVFFSERKESQNEISYFILHSSIEDSPLGISIDKNGSLCHPLSSIFWGGGSLLQEIEIYTYDEIWESERVIYDAALLFKFDDDRLFCIYVIDSIGEQLGYTYDYEIINKELEGLKHRETIGIKTMDSGNSVT